jgi:hypothetical protein
MTMNEQPLREIPKVKKTKQDLQWEAESDVRSLIEAGKVNADPARLKRAKAEASKQAKALKTAI